MRESHEDVDPLVRELYQVADLVCQARNAVVTRAAVDPRWRGIVELADQAACQTTSVALESWQAMEQQDVAQRR